LVERFAGAAGVGEGFGAEGAFEERAVLGEDELAVDCWGGAEGADGEAV